jgi:hypothetical protein
VLNEEEDNGNVLYAFVCQIKAGVESGILSVTNNE